VVNQQTEEAFEQAYQELKSLYAEQQALISYLDTEKYPKRQQFVKAFASSTLTLAILPLRAVKVAISPSNATCKPTAMTL
jgi:hypothetical protein